MSAGVMSEPLAAKASAYTSPDSCAQALCRAIDLGVNCIDLGFPELYPQAPEIVKSVNNSLDVSYRRHVRFNINLPFRQARSADDLDCLLDQRLALWGLEQAPLCTLHCLDRGSIEQMRQIELSRWAERALAQGRIGMLGFSFHDDAHYLEQIFPLCPHWSFLRLEYSLADYRHHPGVGGVELAGKNGCGIIAAQPLKAGRLLTPSYENVEQAWAKACGEHSRLVCALQWLYNDPAISTVQFEFAGPEQAQEYIAEALECRPEALDSFDLLWDNKVREAYYANRMFKCTTCRCCMPCPAGVDAPRIIELYHESMMFREDTIPKLYYQLEGHGRTACVQCGACEKNCPKHYPIMELLARAAQRFS